MNILKGKGILLPVQKNILVNLAKLKDSSFFYLTGGTALSEFYLAHRLSYDLDFFTSETGLILPFTKILEENLIKEKYKFKANRKFESFVEYEIEKEGESTILYFAYDSAFRFDEPQLSELGIKVNDFKDLIVDKLLTFFGRWKHRDAIDLYFILKTEKIETLMEMAKQKDPVFDPYWFCIALQEVKDFPNEVDKWHIDMLVDIDIKKLKELFLNLSRMIMDKIKGMKGKN